MRQEKCCCYMDSYRKVYYYITLMESPAVPGAQNYKELCIATKREEQILAELKGINST